MPNRILFVFLFLCLAPVLVFPQTITNPVALATTPRPELPLSQVFIVHAPHAMSAFTPRPPTVNAMVERGLLALTGKKDISTAWHSLLSTQDVVGIKVYSAPGALSGTRPTVVAALVQSLLAAGLAPSQIIIWDKRMPDLIAAGFGQLATRFNVELAASQSAGYDSSLFYEAPLLGKLLWGDLEFAKTGEGVGRRSFLTKLLTQRITKIINLSPLLTHSLAGVSGNLYSLAFGSVDNTLRFENTPEHAATALPEIYAMRELSDRVILNIVDALICQYQGEEHTRLHYAIPLSQLRFSNDPVALDVLSLQELKERRNDAGVPQPNIDFQIYKNAALLELGTANLDRIHTINIRLGD